MEYYSLLNLPVDATPDEIRSAYFEAAKKYHPDAVSDEADSSRFIEIQKAYEILANAKQRAAYDLSLPEGVHEPGNVKIDVKFSRTALHRSKDPQLLYALVDISCEKNYEPRDLPPIHICIIVDRSLSMRGERLNMVRSNIMKMIRRLKTTDVVSVVTFSDRAEVLVPPGEIQDANRFESLIYRIEPFGATEIYQGLELGFEVFRRYAGRSNSLKHLLLITDGHTYGDEERCYELAERANLEGVAINVLGIGHEWNDKFIDRLTSISGGSSVFIRHQEDLADFIEQKIHSLNLTYARRMEFRLELPDDVRLGYAFKIVPDVGAVTGEFPIQLGALEYSRKTSVILEFEIDSSLKLDPEALIARGKVVLEVPSRIIPFERVWFELRRPLRSDWVKEKVPTDILNAMSKLSLYRLQEKAREEALSGNISGASTHLKYLATRLMASGNVGLAQSALLEVEHLEKYQKLSEAGEKEIKYGTRSLFLLPDPEMKAL